MSDDAPVRDTTVGEAAGPDAPGIDPSDLPTTEIWVAEDDLPDEDLDTRPLDELLDDLYHGQERISQADIYRRAVAAELPSQLLSRLSALPQGEYSVDEVTDLLGGDQP